MPLLELDGVTAAYGDGVEVLHGVSLRVEEGELVTLIGANGAGKTTTLRTIAGLLKPSGGTVRFRGEDLRRRATPDIVRLGMAMVPEGRGVFPGLTVHDNLRIAATPWARRGVAIDPDLDRVYALFPALAERKSQLGWSLSGGQQQMLAIGRALVSRPALMLLDEPSLGLAPLLVEQVFQTLASINQKQGVAVLLVEQNAFRALSISKRAYVLERGRVAVESASAELVSDERLKAAYLGTA